MITGMKGVKMNSLDDAANAFLEAAVEEALDLLNTASFSLQQPYHAPRFCHECLGFRRIPMAREPGTLRVQVLCFAAGHLAVGWDGVPLVLIETSSDDERLEWLEFLRFPRSCGVYCAGGFPNGRL